MHRAHSRIGASSLYRWGNCPGSVAASEGMPNQSSVHAAEGTVAHGVGEIMLRRELMGAEDTEDVTGAEEVYEVPAVGTLVEQEGHQIEVTQDMLDFVRVYVDAVKAEANKPGALVYIECRFDLSTLHPGMYGTADAVVENPIERKLYVFDLKYGRGVVVEVEDNEQLQFYAVGALLKTGANVDTVEIIIAQPRIEHADGAIRRWTTTPLDLVDFSSDLVRKARATEDPAAPLRAGEWCRFCPAAGRPCPKLESEAQAVARQDFAPLVKSGVPQYDPADLSRALQQLPMIEAYVKRVREFAFYEALQGRGSPDHKLVEKRATRSWRSEKTAADWLRFAHDLADDQMFDAPALKSPAAIEKLLSKAERAALAPLIKKDSSGVTLAPIDDKRVAVKRDALSEFSSVVTQTTE